MTIWINEQIDPCGILYSCIATCNEEAAQDCHRNWQNDLSETQKKEGWIVQLRTVENWEQVPVNALKLNV